MTLQTFKVIGIGSFPFDMLRYDNCFPNGQEDTATMTDENRTEQRTVELRRIVRRKGILPAMARWQSFGWRVDVDSIQGRTI